MKVVPHENGAPAIPDAPFSCPTLAEPAFAATAGAAGRAWLTAHHAPDAVAGAWLARIEDLLRAAPAEATRIRNR